MNILVCIKQVPGTSQVEIDEKTGTLKRDGVAAKMNPFDLYALETALRIKEKVKGKGEGEEVVVTALTMGPPQCEKVVREAFMMGVDRGIILLDRAFGGCGWRYDAEGCLSPTNAAKILSKKSYGPNFDLDCVYKLDAAGNSGLYIYDSEHPKAKSVRAEVNDEVFTDPVYKEGRFPVAAHVTWEMPGLTIDWYDGEKAVPGMSKTFLPPEFLAKMAAEKTQYKDFFIQGKVIEGAGESRGVLRGEDALSRSRACGREDRVEAALGRDPVEPSAAELRLVDDQIAFVGGREYVSQQLRLSFVVRRHVLVVNAECRDKGLCDVHVRKLLRRFAAEDGVEVRVVGAAKSDEHVV